MITTKVCGVCRPRDATAAVAAGADAVGVILAPAGRQVSIEEAEAIFAVVPADVARVAVFVDADPEFVREATERLSLDYVQFHGDESPADCEAAPAPVIKAFKVGSGFDAAVVEPYRRVIAFVMLDADVPGKAGGTGEPFDWEAVAPQLQGMPVIVAGGLHAENVAKAIDILRPACVDVSGGVEARPREKDPEKLRAFCDAVRAANDKERTR